MSKRPARSRLTLRLITLAMCLFMSTGCSIYDSDFFYEPRPLDVSVPAGDEAADDRGSVRALMTVIGVRTRADEADIPPSVELRIRIENSSPAEVIFDPDDLALLSADLQPFDPPIVEPWHSATITPDAPLTITAYFPFPDESGREAMDLSGLNLRWSVRIDGRRIERSSTFTHRPRHRQSSFSTGVGVYYGTGRWGYGGHWHRPWGYCD